MLTIVQSKIGTGTTLAFDSPVTAGNTVLVFFKFDNPTVILTPTVTSTPSIDFIQFEFLQASWDIPNVCLYIGIVGSTDTLSTDIGSDLSSGHPIISLVEFSDFPDIDFYTDRLGSTPLEPAVFPDASTGDFCYYCAATSANDCVFDFPTGTIINSLNGSGALAVGYRIASAGLGTISCEGTTGTQLFIAGRWESGLVSPLSIGCGTLHHRGGIA